MKKKTQLVQGKIMDIIKDIKSDVLVKHDLGDLHVVSITFAKTGNCPDGFSWVCKSFGTDPVTKKPIIKCSCMPDDEA